MAIRSYRDLTEWQKAMELVIESYRLAAQLPSHEVYRLASQLRRAAVSISANIAEGNGRLHRGEYAHHLSIPRGSLTELETLVDITCRLDYLRADELTSTRELIDHVGRMLTRLTAALRD